MSNLQVKPPSQTYQPPIQNFKSNLKSNLKVKPLNLTSKSNLKSNLKLKPQSQSSKSNFKKGSRPFSLIKIVKNVWNRITLWNIWYHRTLPGRIAFNLVSIYHCNGSSKFWIFWIPFTFFNLNQFVLHIWPPLMILTSHSLVGSVLTTGFWGKEAWGPTQKWNTRFFFAFSKRIQLGYLRFEGNGKIPLER